MPIVSSTSNKVLFLGHDAAPHGAQILLLNLLRWFAENRSFPFEILLKEGGVLEADFAQTAPCRIWQKPVSLRNRILSLMGDRELLQTYGKRIGLVYSNTITNGDLLEMLSPLGCPVISHVHELENYIHMLGRKNFDKVKRCTSLFIAASHAVKENLVANHGIPDERVRVVHSFIPAASFSTSSLRRSREELLRELGIPETAFVVGGCGTTDWRKSPELFVQLAGFLKRSAPTSEIYFLWVGGHTTWELEYDVKKLGIDTIRFVPHVANTADYYQAMDLFALVSRIDPYPLVCLEAASLGKPILCFDRAGGMPEFVEDDCGYVVPYLGIDAMAEKILFLHDNRDICRQLGTNGQDKVRERHDVSVAGSEIAGIIKEYVSSQATGRK